MTAPINMALYRLLMKAGASEAEAQEAARLGSADLATKADLRLAIAQLRVDLQKSIIQGMLAMTAIFGMIVVMVKLFG